MIEITQKTTKLELEKARYLYLKKENRIRSIHSSLAIEDNSLSYEQVTDIINGKKVLGPLEDIHEVQNAYETYNLVFRMNPYSIDDFLAVHQLMTKGLIKESGQFRSTDVGVFDSGGNLMHMGARPQFVHDLINELFEWAEQSTVPDLIKSCILHFEIEMIHPYADGNGRLGRLWQNLILSKWQQVFEWIPIETMVYKNQMKYYEMLAIGNKENDATKFIEFMLEVILQTIEEFDRANLRETVSDKNKAFFDQIYPHLKENNTISNSKAVQLTGQSSATVRRYLTKLVQLGVLGSAGENRNRHYFLLSIPFD